MKKRRGCCTCDSPFFCTNRRKNQAVSTPKTKACATNFRWICDARALLNCLIIRLIFTPIRTKEGAVACATAPSFFHFLHYSILERNAFSLGCFEMCIRDKCNATVCIGFIAEYFLVNQFFLNQFGVVLTDYKGINHFGRTNLSNYIYRMLCGYGSFFYPSTAVEAVSYTHLDVYKRQGQWHQLWPVP